MPLCPMCGHELHPAHTTFVYSTACCDTPQCRTDLAWPIVMRHVHGGTMHRHFKNAKGLRFYVPDWEQNVPFVYLYGKLNPNVPVACPI